MSTIVLDELRTTLDQDFSVLHRRSVYAVRPNLYFHNDASGTYTIAIKDGSTTLGSASLSMTTILANASWTVNQYHFGVVNFQFDDEIVIQADTTYTIELSSTGYGFLESSYTGWIKSYANKINTFTGTAETDFNNAFDVEVWSKII